MGDSTNVKGFTVGNEWRMEPTHEEKKRREEEIFRLLVGGKLDPDAATILSIERAYSMRSRGVRIWHNQYNRRCMCQSCMPGKVVWSAWV